MGRATATEAGTGECVGGYRLHTSFAFRILVARLRLRGRANTPRWCAPRPCPASLWGMPPVAARQLHPAPLTRRGLSGRSTDSLHASDAAGVVPRFLDRVLEHAKQNCLEWSMAVSFVELHNEELRDLLNDQTAENRARPITLRDSARGGVIVQVQRTEEA
jgi:hypothetical protein